MIKQESWWRKLWSKRPRRLKPNQKQVRQIMVAVIITTALVIWFSLVNAEVHHGKAVDFSADSTEKVIVVGSDEPVKVTALSSKGYFRVSAEDGSFVEGVHLAGEEGYIADPELDHFMPTGVWDVDQSGVQMTAVSQDGKELTVYIHQTVFIKMFTLALCLVLSGVLSAMTWIIMKDVQEGRF